MLLAAIIVWAIVAGLAGYAAMRRPSVHGPALRVAVDFLKPLAVRLPLAILAAGFIGQLLPAEAVSAALGDDTGLPGIALAGVNGGILPGGPMVTFPLVVSIYQVGAGTAQTVALLTAWSVYAVHRVLAFELPMMGLRFVLFRIAISLALPFVAGFLTALVQGWQAAPY